MSRSRPRLKVIINWQASLLVVMLLPVVCSLGFWQLQRSDEKHAMQQLFEQRKASAPVMIEELDDSSDLRYQPVRMRGEYLNDKAIFLDNRIYQGRFGYEIITPVKLASSGSVVLVNRGWLQGDRSRRSLPAIRHIEGEVILLGEVHVPVGKPLRLGRDDAQGWPKVVQTVDVAALTQELSHQVFPYTVRLAHNQAGAEQANWVVVNMTPEKHTGYAVQWFAMGVALLLIGLLSNTNLWACIAWRDK